jgi:hypothetical protein
MNIKATPEKKAAFLTALMETCSVAKACIAVDINRTTAYRWRDDDAPFAAAWEVAKDLGADVLEDEAVRRAHDGIPKPIYHMGACIDTVQEYSDTLLIFLLKGARPAKYKDRVEHSGDAFKDKSEAELRAELEQKLKMIQTQTQEQEGHDLV